MRREVQKFESDSKIDLLSSIGRQVKTVMRNIFAPQTIIQCFDFYRNFNAYWTLSLCREESPTGTNQRNEEHTQQKHDQPLRIGKVQRRKIYN